MRYESLIQEFTADYFPDWICPECGVGSLKEKEGTFHSAHTKKSRDSYDPESYDTRDESYVFICILECSRQSCREVVACNGVGRGDLVDVDDIHLDMAVTFYRVTHFVPTLKAFALPEHYPEKICTALVNAFGLFLSNPSAAANSIRIAVEELMIDLGVAAKEDDGRFIPLDRRLKKIPQKHSEFQGRLSAIKWLGNAGSHTYDKVKISDIEEAFEIIEYVLSRIYDESAIKTAKLAEEMTMRHKN